jgi:hypothetical protein
MEKLRMVNDRGFTQRSPIVDGVSIVLCDLKLAIEGSDHFDVVNEAVV